MSLFADWLRREWDMEHGERQQVQSLVIRFDFKHLPPPGGGEPTRGSVQLYQRDGESESMLSCDEIAAEIHRLTAAKSPDSAPLDRPAGTNSL